MKKIVSLLLIALFPLFVNATDFQEGKHYNKVQELAVKSPEVREYFSFYCGHCYKFEFIAKSIEKHLPQGATLVKNHVDFLPGASRKMQTMLTYALITAQEMGISDSQNAAIFKYIHVHRAVFTSKKDIRNVFLLNGADGEEFDQLMSSDNVRLQAEEMRSNQDIMGTSGDLKSVPSIIVNGKYMIHTHDLDKNNLEQEYNDLVKYLLALD
jgi:thiol:disulfide interchange protein DsbA